MKKLLAVVLLFALALSFAACSTKDPSIVGTWIGKDGDNELTYEFRDDGTGTATAGKATADFTYAIEDGRLSVTVGGKTNSASFTLTKDTLSLTDEYGTSVLTRK